MAAGELDDDDLASEAIDFVRAAHAFIAWHEASGTIGFPRSEARARPSAAVAQQRAPEARMDAPATSREQPRFEASAASFEASPGPAPIVSHDSPPPNADGARMTAGEAAIAFEPPKLETAKPVLAEVPVDLVPEERVRRLELIDARVQSCTSCGLHATRRRTVFSRGSPNAELCFVGEGPGEEEDRQGLPFVGKAGQLLDKMILAMGLSRDDVYVCNVVKCRPPDNRTPEPSEMATCLPYLNEQLDIVRPKAIVALGGTALKGLMGPSEGITKARGSWRLYRGQIPLMPTFHPAYILRQSTREVKAQVWSDLQQVLQRLGRKAPSRGNPD